MSANRWTGAANHAMCHPDRVRIPRSHSARVADGTSLTRQSSDPSMYRATIRTLLRIAPTTAGSDTPSISSSMFIARSSPSAARHVRPLDMFRVHELTLSQSQAPRCFELNSTREELWVFRLPLVVRHLRQTMIGKPLMAHESQTRLSAAIVAPRGALRDDARDCDGEDDPHDVHRYSPVIARRTIRE